MNCPKCKDVDLKKNGYDTPYSCTQCGGMWLEFDKVPSFFEKMSSVEQKVSNKNLNDDKTGFCPSGHGLMTRAKVEDAENPFFLEKCSSCGGIWFDNDEWQRIINKNLIDNINNFWCSSWQAQQRKQKSRNSYLLLNRKILGDNIFNKIIELSGLLKEHPDKGRAIALLQQEIR